MTYYCVNKNAQANGDHEVHKAGCDYYPAEENRLALGDHNSCQTAVTKAKSLKPNWKINGCYYCSNACHTS